MGTADSCCQLQTGPCPEHLPVTEQQEEHLPSASAETEPCAAAAVDLQRPRREFGVESEALCVPGKLVEWVFRYLDIFQELSS